MKSVCIIAMSVVGIMTSSANAADVSRASMESAGRNVMRTADGGLVAAYAKEVTGRSQLVFSASMDNGRTWRETVVTGPSHVIQCAIDSNFQGSYIAYTEKVGDKVVGRIAFTTSPFAEDPKFQVSGSVSLEGIEPQDTFIQASRKGWGDKADQDRETVVFGWQDAKSKSLYVGVSFDGQKFPVARQVVADQAAVSGPSVAIRGRYVIAVYLTQNIAIAPTDLPSDLRGKRAYQAWVESTDGGQTWTAPQPLFGKTLAEYPQIDVLTKSGAMKMRLGGGTDLPLSAILNWANTGDDPEDPKRPDDTKRPEDPKRPDGKKRPEDPKRPDDTKRPEDPKRPDGKKRPEDPKRLAVSGGTTFVQSTLRCLGEKDGGIGEVGVVSFKPISPGASWVHVVANNAITTDPQARNAKVSLQSATTSHFQYSALVDTPVRATLYHENDQRTKESRIVLAVSTDTGKNFTLHTSLSSADLEKYGIREFGMASISSASQCLFEDRDGGVYVDVLHLRGGKLEYARIPTGVNAAELRKVERKAASEPGINSTNK